MKIFLRAEKEHTQEIDTFRDAANRLILECQQESPLIPLSLERLS